MSANQDRREDTEVCDVDFPYRVCSISETGPVREKNEDSMVHFDSPFGHVVIVADGMGGHGHGDLAAALVVNGFQESLLSQDGSSVPVPDAIHTACSLVNNRIMEIGESVQHAVIGSTVVLVVLTHGDFYVAHVGDSRAYLMRDGTLTRLTKDHSVVQREIDDGFLTEDQARTDSRSSMLTRALGTPNGNDIEIRGPMPMEDGDGILLSSDGLHGFAHDRQIEDAVLCNNLDPQKVTRGLVNLAIGTYFSNDNVTVQYIQIGKPKPNQATRPVFGRPKSAGPAVRAVSEEIAEASPPRRLWLRILLWLNSVLVLGALGLGATHPAAVGRLVLDLRQPADAGKAAANISRHVGQAAEPRPPGSRSDTPRPEALRMGVVVNDRKATAEVVLKTIGEYEKSFRSPNQPSDVTVLLLLDEGSKFPAGKKNELLIDNNAAPKFPPRFKDTEKRALPQPPQIDALLVVNKAGEDPGISPPAPAAPSGRIRER